MIQSTDKRCQCIANSTKLRCKNIAGKNGLCAIHNTYGCKLRYVPQTTENLAPILKHTYQQQQRIQNSEIIKQPTCDKLGGMINESNSCYFDSLIYAILYRDNELIDHYILHADIRQKSKIILDIQQELNNLKKLINDGKKVTCKKLRFLLDRHQKETIKTDKNLDHIEWLHEMNEPIDVILRLNYIFNIPDLLLLELNSYGGTPTQIKQGKQQLASHDIRKVPFTIMVSADEIRTESVINLSDYINKTSYTTFEKDNYFKTESGSYPIRVEETVVHDTSLLHIHIIRLVEEYGENGHVSRTKLTTKIVPQLYFYLANGNMLTLTSIMVHSGSTSSGHYYAYINCHGIWYMYDDIHFTKLIKVGTFSQLLQSEKMLSNATDYFYMK